MAKRRKRLPRGGRRPGWLPRTRDVRWWEVVREDNWEKAVDAARELSYRLADREPTDTLDRRAIAALAALSDLLELSEGVEDKHWPGM